MERWRSWRRQGVVGPNGSHRRGSDGRAFEALHRREHVIRNEPVKSREMHRRRGREGRAGDARDDTTCGGAEADGGGETPAARSRSDAPMALARPKRRGSAAHAR